MTSNKISLSFNRRQLSFVDILEDRLLKPKAVILLSGAKDLCFTCHPEAKPKDLNEPGEILRGVYPA
jgi:hypothetical protein